MKWNLILKIKENEYMLEFALQHEIITLIIVIVILLVIYDLNVIWANTLKARYMSQANNKRIKIIRKYNM